MGWLTHLVFSQGERYPILLDPEGVPDYWVTLYVTEKLRTSLKQTTIENTIRHIIHLKLWEQINGRNLILEFSQGRFLSESDIFSLRDHCLLSTRDLRQWSQLKSKKKCGQVVLKSSIKLASFGIGIKITRCQQNGRYCRISEFH